MAEKPETTFKKRVQKDLETLNNCWFVKTQMVAIRGIPDFFICLDGKFIALELKKSEDEKRNPLQEWTLHAIAHSNGMALIAFPENWNVTFEMLESMAGVEDGKVEISH